MAHFMGEDTMSRVHERLIHINDIVKPRVIAWIATTQPIAYEDIDRIRISMKAV